MKRGDPTVQPECPLGQELRKVGSRDEHIHLVSMLHLIRQNLPGVFR